MGIGTVCAFFSMLDAMLNKTHMEYCPRACYRTYIRTLAGPLTTLRNSMTVYESVSMF